eukprot:TRINITY_DN15562_c0_g1_i1.p1 TRINITY_DN15562_c0_g1~~TRINITY_DN15562_c0_g1_i1.p1  ORF type:complete len:112 (+),score=10.15 TRINITY_DN15562_c0_g1_i1:41-376(+)
MAKSRILIIGATGNLGHHLAKASLTAGHPTFALVRSDSPALDKSERLESIVNAGATLIKGSLQDHWSLAEAIQQVDVVICAVSAKHVIDQKLLIGAIKEAGSIKRLHIQAT